MNKNDFIKKLTSRKFISMLMGLLSMVLITRGMPDNQIAQIMSIVGGFGSIVVYIFAEAYIDANTIPVEPVNPTIPNIITTPSMYQFTDISKEINK